MYVEAFYQYRWRQQALVLNSEFDVHQSSAKDTLGKFVKILPVNVEPTLDEHETQGAKLELELSFSIPIQCLNIHLSWQSFNSEF